MNNKYCLFILTLLPILLQGFVDSSEEDSSDLDLDEEWYDLWWVWTMFGIGLIIFIGLIIWTIRYYRIHRIIPEVTEEADIEQPVDA